ncbi:hypothetical protein [Ensifer sp. Root278]|nr:hypothetical protein [Ensifer sp. Root278]
MPTHRERCAESVGKRQAVSGAHGRRSILALGLALALALFLALRSTALLRLFLPLFLFLALAALALPLFLLLPLGLFLPLATLSLSLFLALLLPLPLALSALLLPLPLFLALRPGYQRYWLTLLDGGGLHSLRLAFEILLEHRRKAAATPRPAQRSGQSLPTGEERKGLRIA